MNRKKGSLSRLLRNFEEIKYIMENNGNYLKLGRLAYEILNSPIDQESLDEIGISAEELLPTLLQSKDLYLSRSELKPKILEAYDELEKICYGTKKPPRPKTPYAITERIIHEAQKYAIKM